MSSWKPIDTVPKKGMVLLWSVGSSYNNPGYYIGRYEWIGQGYVPVINATIYSSSAEQFTHWSPLPEPPK